MPDYVSTRRMGQATVSIVSEGTLNWAPKFAAPEAELRAAIPELSPEGTLPLDINLAHVACGSASIVIDPGCDEPGSRWQERFAARWPGMRRTAGLAAALAALGVDPGRVTHVLITHAHADHFAGVLIERDGQEDVRFPRARHLIMRQDWSENPARTDPASELAVRLGPIDRAGLLDVLDGEREVLPGVTMVPTPGETPGHAAVRVAAGGASFYYLGDLFHHPCEVARPEWVPPNRDAAAARASRRRISSEAAAAGAVVVFSHARFPAWGCIRAAGSGYCWAPDR